MSLRSDVEAPLPEDYRAWRDGLRAELVTHASEPLDVVLARLELERYNIILNPKEGQQNGW